MANYLAASLEFSINAISALIDLYLYLFFVIVAFILGIYFLFELLNFLLYRYNFSALLGVFNWIRNRPRWLKDMCNGILLSIFVRLIVSMLLSLSYIPSLSQVSSWGSVPTPFIGDLTISEYVDVVNWFLGLAGFVMLIILLLGGTFITFSFGNNFFRGIGMFLFFLVFFLLFIAMFFQIIVNGLLVGL